MKKTLGLIVPVVPAILLLCGCGSFALPSVYILGNPTPAAVSVTSEDGLPIVAIDTVTVPDYLDSTDIVRHAGSNEVRVSATGKWGERLSVGLTRALVSEEKLGANEPADDLLNMDGMNRKLAFELASRGIVTMEDLAEQSIDDLIDIEGVDATKAGELIMKAREPWFS